MYTCICSNEDKGEGDRIGDSEGSFILHECSRVDDAKACFLFSLAMFIGNLVEHQSKFMKLLIFFDIRHAGLFVEY